METIHKIVGLEFIKCYPCKQKKNVAYAIDHLCGYFKFKGTRVEKIFKPLVKYHLELSICKN